MNRENPGKTPQPEYKCPSTCLAAHQFHGIAGFSVDQSFPRTGETDQKNFNIARESNDPFKGPILAKNAGVNKMPSTKVELNCNQIARIQGLDEVARLLFPRNRNHQKVFLAIFIELKYASGEFLPSLAPLCDKYGFTPRTLETVRSKMRRMGIIEHVSRFNKVYGYREGWLFSSRFSRALIRLKKLAEGFKERTDAIQEQKDRDLFMYI